MSKTAESYLAFAAVVVGLAGNPIVDLLKADGLKLPVLIVSCVVALAGAVRLATNPSLLSGASAPVDPPKEGAK